jgi:hypothetical protein
LIDDDYEISSNTGGEIIQSFRTTRKLEINYTLAPILVDENKTRLTEEEKGIKMSGFHQDHRNLLNKKIIEFLSLSN